MRRAAGRGAGNGGGRRRGGGAAGRRVAFIRVRPGWVVECAKDGLLPLVEALGPDPWLPRLREIADIVIARADIPTPHGPIPSPAAEVNGSALQVLARLHLGLPTDYPRSNQWPERWAVEGDASYALDGEAASPTQVRGDTLAAELPLILEPGREYRLRACPA